MPLPSNPWRNALQPASWRGAGFKVEVDTQAGGRRGPVHEFPQRDTPWAEDMGRKARRWPMTAYLIGPNYIPARDALIAACEAEGPGTLQHPLLGQVQANLESYSVSESRERGGYCAIDMSLVEAGNLDSEAPATDTQAAVQSTAATANTEIGNTLDAQLKAMASSPANF